MRCRLFLFLGALCWFIADSSRLSAQTIDATTLTGKFMVGYQGWHACENDGSAMNKYVHWGHADNAQPATNDVVDDIWPDLSEFPANELFPSSLVLGSGQPAKVYSCYTSNTVSRHFKWMRDYGIDGAMHQRFIKDVKLDANWAALRNTNLINVRAGAETYGRIFCVMYDMSNDDPAQVISHLQTDWTFLTGSLQITNSARYARHKGKPVVVVWGLGLSGVAVPPADAQTIINYFKASGCTVMGGVPYNWRTLNGDAQTNAAWTAVYHSFDILSPWAVGRYSTSGQADSAKTSTLAPDLSDCVSHNIDYMPVVFPGYSAHNLGGSALNSIPRFGGRFFWRQIYNAVSAGVPMLYGAMFDEIDEGTALYKLAPTMNETPAMAPTNGFQFFALNADGESLPSDWYLRVTGLGTRSMHGTDPLSAFLPITPTNSITITSPNGGNNWTAGAPANITWNTTGTVASVNIDLSTDGGASFRSLVYNLTNSGSCAVNVPFYASANCRVRIQSVSGAPVDWSDTNFAIKVTQANPNIGWQSLWSLTPGSQSYLPDSTANTARGLACNPAASELYLINTATLAVNVLDGATGTNRGTLNTSGIAVVSSGGGFSLAKIGAGADGAIYAGNVRVSIASGAPFNLYRWANSNPATAPTLAYSGTAGFANGLRVGDTFAVRGAGTNTQVLVGARGVNALCLLTTADGLTFTPHLLTTDASANQLGGALVFGNGNSFWGATNGLPPARLNFDPISLVATTAQVFNTSSFPSASGPVGFDPQNALLAVVELTDGPDQVNLYDLSVVINPPPLVVSDTIPGRNDNNFGLGAVCFAANRMFVLDANNGVAAFRLLFPGSATLLSEGISGSNLLLSWPSTARGFFLERSSALPPVTWQSVLQQVTLGSNQNVVTQAVASPAGFFRLDRP